MEGLDWGREGVSDFKWGLTGRKEGGSLGEGKV
jgi:hypothetical protein